MALECAHCGSRVADGSTRCPNCLRSTALVEIPTSAGTGASLPRRRNIVAAVLGIAALAGGGVWLAAKLRRHHGRRDESPIAASLRDGAEMPEPFAAHGTTSVWVNRVRSGANETARARSVMELVTAALAESQARLVDDPHDAPRARSVDDIARAVATRDGRVTTLDLARLMVSILHDAGVPRAAIAEQLTRARPGEPADPTALLGRYVTVVGDDAIDLDGHALIAAREIHAQPLDESSLEGAMLAQSALHGIHSGAQRDRVLALADSAVARWHDGTVPLAVRAAAWQAAGASGGLGLASQDLASAVALRDGDAALHLLRARYALMSGRGDVVDSEVRAALARGRAFGLAALAASIVGTETVDGGDRCAALADAHGDWTTFAWTICHGGGSGALDVREAGDRLARASTDPMALAFAAVAGAEGTLARVHASDRDEYVSWLAAMGRRDLAAAAIGRADAGR